MNRFVVFLGLFALVLAAQPVFMASAGTKLYVEQEGSEDAKSEDGGYKIYNSVPTDSDDYSVPLSNKLVTTPTRPKTVRGIPSTWRVLDDNVIQNRLADTKAALAVAAKMRKKITQPEPWPSALEDDDKNRTGVSIVTNERDAEDNKEEVEKDMEKQKKKADKIAKKKAEEDQKKKEEADKKKEGVASGTAEEETAEKSNSLKRKKKDGVGAGERVFNLPD